jgi:hypothetical protein
MAPPLPKLQKKLTTLPDCCQLAPPRCNFIYYGVDIGQIEVAVAVAEDISAGFASLKKV